jgi:hypothetical protein
LLVELLPSLLRVGLLVLLLVTCMQFLVGNYL